MPFFLRGFYSAVWLCVPQCRFCVPQGRSCIPTDRICVPPCGFCIPQVWICIPTRRSCVPKSRLSLPQRGCAFRKASLGQCYGSKHYIIALVLIKNLVHLYNKIHIPNPWVDILQCHNMHISILNRLYISQHRISF